MPYVHHTHLVVLGEDRCTKMKYCILLECANEPTHQETLANGTVVDVCDDHRDHPRNTLGAESSVHLSHRASSKTPPILAQQSCAVSDPMECTLTLLPQSQCSHCTGATDLVDEAPWDVKDYAQKEFTDLNGDIERQGIYSEPEVQVGSVHPREIYGPELRAMKIKVRA